MIFKEAGLKGAYSIKLEPIRDGRGFFARSFCKKEFESHGIKLEIVQSNVSYNEKRGTLRGMHYQIAPHEEAKIVSCVNGAMHDVIIDMRPDSSTYLNWFSIELSARNYMSLYVPKGFAHGFQTIEDDTVVLYQMSEFYNPESARAVRWDDPAFDIKWPILPCLVSEKDASYPYYKDRSKRRMILSDTDF